ncbi:sulfhydryl oxidase 2-like isoform X2 [Corticium candelabrum]|uniref:sulfhydryl oxidase 2-like isoform X2 n=1 Tax=Corticium candelabrum TaxID=121492 RepID=UPI002E256057|nr:sulfhydryl oxidase 2-like isoform X2 [Corticium candelabrum]
MNQLSASLLLLVLSLWFVAAYDCQLYSEEDDLVCFSNSSLKKAVLESDFCWIVEFYASWCGHCHHFAPTWKNFAHSVKNWTTVARVGVIDCGNRVNTASCQHFKVQGFPTIRLFYAHSKMSEVGVEVRERGINGLQQSVIKHIESQPNSPHSWPVLKPVDSVTTVKQWMLAQTAGQQVFLIIEDKESYLGRQVIMEMYGQHNKVKIRRATNNQSDIAAFCGVAYFPAIVVISKGKLDKLKSDGKDLLSYITAVTRELEKKRQVDKKTAEKKNIRDVVHKKKPQIASQDIGKTQQKNVKSHQNSRVDARRTHHRKPTVYLEDLVATLTFSFRHEIPLHDISGSRFKTLNRFVQLLSSCLPVPMTIRHMLDQLSNRMKLIDLRLKKIDVSTWMRLTSPEQYRGEVQPHQQWVACKGSEPHYRGYPCGLWTLFHTAVINCARYDPTLQKTCSRWTWRRAQPKSHLVVPGSKHIDITEILSAIHDYIRDFFGCRQCSENFSKMAVDISKEVSTPSDGVLWLWRAHNKANMRLRDAKSSDPEYPKIQFPSSEQCPHCRTTASQSDGNIPWDKSAVLCFLMDMYRHESIRSISTSVHRPVVTHGIRIKPRIHSYKNQIEADIHTPLFYGMDWKFSVFLYFISMAALVFIGWTLLRSRSCKRRRLRFNLA